MILYLIGMVSGINNGLQLALTTFPTGTVFSGIPTPVSICAEYIQANNTIFVYILTSTSIYILDVSTNSKTLIASGIPDATALKQFNTDLIVASNTNDQIYRATKTGALYSTINTVVSLKTFAIDNYGYIYYSDGGNTVYQVIASTHSLYITIGTNITSLTIDFNNYLYIADNSSNIYKVAPNGESVILGSGWIQSPKVLTADATGNIYLIDQLNTGSAIRMFDSYGNLYAVNSTCTNISDITVDSLGNIFVLDAALGNIVYIAPNQYYSLNCTANYTYNSQTKLCDPNYFFVSLCLQYDGVDEVIYLSDFGTGSVAKYSITAQTYKYYSIAASSVLYGIRPTSTGIIIAEGGNSAIQKLSLPSGNTIQVLQTYNVNEQVFCAVSDSSGNIYYSTLGSDVKMISASSGAISVYMSGFVGADGLQFDSAGNLYVGDASTGELWKCTKDGNKAEILKGKMGILYGFCFDANNNIYLAGKNTGFPQVTKYDPYGNYYMLNHNFISPTDVAVDSLGNVYVTDNGKLVIFGPSNFYGLFCATGFWYNTSTNLCNACPGGTYYFTGVCIDCPQNTFSVYPAISSNCTACEDLLISNAGSSFCTINPSVLQAVSNSSNLTFVSNALNSAVNSVFASINTGDTNTAISLITNVTNVLNTFSNTTTDIINQISSTRNSLVSNVASVIDIITYSDDTNISWINDSNSIQSVKDATSSLVTLLSVPEQVSGILIILFQEISQKQTVDLVNSIGAAYVGTEIAMDSDTSSSLFVCLSSVLTTSLLARAGNTINATQNTTLQVIQQAKFISEFIDTLNIFQGALSSGIELNGPPVIKNSSIMQVSVSKSDAANINYVSLSGTEVSGLNDALQGQNFSQFSGLNQTEKVIVTSISLFKKNPFDGFDPADSQTTRTNVLSFSLKDKLGNMLPVNYTERCISIKIPYPEPVYTVTINNKGSLNVTQLLSWGRNVTFSDNGNGSFTIRFYPNCQYFDETEFIWKRNGCSFVPSTNLCCCNHLSYFDMDIGNINDVKKIHFAPPKDLDNITLSRLETNPLVLLVFGGIFGVYFVFMIYFLWLEEKIRRKLKQNIQIVKDLRLKKIYKIGKQYPNDLYPTYRREFWPVYTGIITDLHLYVSLFFDNNYRTPFDRAQRLTFITTQLLFNMTILTGFYSANYGIEISPIQAVATGIISSIITTPVIKMLDYYLRSRAMMFDPLICKEESEKQKFLRLLSLYIIFIPLNAILAFILILYGSGFTRIEAYPWLQSFIINTLQDIFIVTPMVLGWSILLYSYIDAFDKIRIKYKNRRLRIKIKKVMNACKAKGLEYTGPILPPDSDNEEENNDRKNTDNIKKSSAELVSSTHTGVNSFIASVLIMQFTSKSKDKKVAKVEDQKHLEEKTQVNLEHDEESHVESNDVPVIQISEMASPHIILGNQDDDPIKTLETIENRYRDLDSDKGQDTELPNILHEQHENIYKSSRFYKGDGFEFPLYQVSKSTQHLMHHAKSNSNLHSTKNLASNGNIQLGSQILNKQEIVGTEDNPETNINQSSFENEFDN